MIEAGSETTSSALNSAIRYLAVYHGVQKKAHNELDRVVGYGRSPTFTDEAQLPYIRACVKEILRIRPVANIGTPHFTTNDIVYKDYFIPKGTVVSINQYALHYDQRYHDPHAFIPERYLDHNLKAGAYTSHPDPLQRDHFSFGAGRRVCPGMHLAENSLYITLAKILWAFEIRPCTSVEGEEEELDVSDDAYEPGSNTLPTPYRVRFMVRNEEVESALNREWVQAKVDGYHLGNVKVNDGGVVVS
jgi:cytochrome P450